MPEAARPVAEAMRTRVTALLGTRYPILQGAAPGPGGAGLAAAFCNAGGLGVLGVIDTPSPQALAAQVERCRGLTDRPFGLRLALSPASGTAAAEACLEAALAGGIRVLEMVGASPKAFIEKCKRQGVRVVHRCASLQEALAAERQGVDAVGIEACTGAASPGDAPALLELAARTLRIPVVACGGITGGRGMAAALALGAEGVGLDPGQAQDIPGCAALLERMVRECGQALARAGSAHGATT